MPENLENRIKREKRENREKAARVNQALACKGIMKCVELTHVAKALKTVNEFKDITRTTSFAVD